jgi:hypothetical protein
LVNGVFNYVEGQREQSQSYGDIQFAASLLSTDYSNDLKAEPRPGASGEGPQEPRAGLGGPTISGLL